MKYLKAFGVLFGGLLGILLVGGWILPNDYDVARSQIIAAPAQEVFGYVADVERFQQWQPWAHRDPTMQVELTEQRTGVGAGYSWTSERAGTGSSKTITSDPPNRIVNTLQFGGMGQSTAYWEFVEEDGFTTALWGLRGSNPGVLGGWVTMVLETPLAADLTAGLLRLKEVVEEAPPAPAAADDDDSAAPGEAPPAEAAAGDPSATAAPAGDGSSE